MFTRKSEKGSVWMYADDAKKWLYEATADWHSYMLPLL